MLKLWPSGISSPKRAVFDVSSGEKAVRRLLIPKKGASAWLRLVAEGFLKTFSALKDYTWQSAEMPFIKKKPID